MRIDKFSCYYDDDYMENITERESLQSNHYKMPCSAVSASSSSFVVFVL